MRNAFAVGLSVSLVFLLAFFSCSKEEALPRDAGVPAPRPAIRVVNDVIGGEPVVVAGNERFALLAAFGRQMPDGALLEFRELTASLPLIMEDGEGNSWDIFGYALSGPRQGQQLPVISAYLGYWFAWGAMYPGVEIFEGENPQEGFEPAMASPGWTVPSEEVFAGSGFDLIKALDFPKAAVYREKDSWEAEYFLHDTSLVLGVKVEGRYRLYPRVVLDFHEIVNDTMGSLHFAAAYHPLSGISTAWNREVLPGLAPTFGVSGLLYNSNLIAFDRVTESLWSQMRQECINGAFLGTPKEVIPVLETTWATWKLLVKNPEIMSFDTGYPYDYSGSPFINYAGSESSTPYPIQFEDTRLPPKERVLGVVVDGKAKVYRFGAFRR